MKRNITYLIMIVVSLILGLLTAIILFQNDNVNKYNGLPVEYISASYMTDTSTPEKAIGVSDYTFVAKINKIIRTEYKNPVTVERDSNKNEEVYMPYTVYSIRVIKNIKGNLVTDEDIEFYQYGGISKNKDYYTFLEGSSYLKEGGTYVIMAGLFENNNIEASSPNFLIPVSDEKMEDLTIQKYIEASKNEVVPEYKLNTKVQKAKYDKESIK